MYSAAIAAYESHTFMARGVVIAWHVCEQALLVVNAAKWHFLLSSCVSLVAEAFAGSSVTTAASIVHLQHVCWPRQDLGPMQLNIYADAVPGKAAGKVPIHFFGTQEFAWMKPNDVISFEAGLQAGMHICKASNRAKMAFRKALHEVSVYFLVGAEGFLAQIGGFIKAFCYRDILLLVISTACCENWPLKGS